MRAARELLREASLELARLRRIRGASHKTWRRIARAKARLAFAAALLAGTLAEPAAADPSFHHPIPLGRTGLGASGSFYGHPTFADIDGDGDVDLFACQGGNSYFLENTGSPRQPALAPPQLNAFGLDPAGSCAALAFADLDGDGDLDATIGNSANQTEFFLNTGTATSPAFAAPVTNPFGLNGAVWELADLDGDGDVDAIQVGFPALWYENTGSPTAPAFAPATPNPFGLGNAQDLADLDGDGDLDGIGGTGGYQYDLILFRNTGSATSPAFAAPVATAVNQVPDGARFDLADLNGDGDLDGFVTGSSSACEGLAINWWLENAGSPAAPDLTALGNPFGIGSRRRTCYAGFYAGAATSLADLDGDGDLDALIGMSLVQIMSPAVTEFEENVGTPAAPRFVPPASNPPGLPVVVGEPDLVDIDADGDLDLFSSTIFFENTGSANAATFGSGVDAPFGLPSASSQVGVPPPAAAFADLDADGDLDALLGQADGSLVLFANTGAANAPAFGAPTTNPFGLADVGSYAAPDLGDLDGDGDLDLLIGASDGSTRFFRNTGSASAPAFAPALVNPFGLADVGPYAASPEIADVDGDGDLDVFVSDGYRRVVFFENVVIDPDACRDGLDNDGDGGIDVAEDPGCADAGDSSELSALECDNGVDDDGDGLIDLFDPGCVHAGDAGEFNPPSELWGCGLGPELLLLAPLLAAARRRRE